MLSIFRSEVSGLESEIAAMQAKIVAAQQRISELTDCESMTGDAINVLQRVMSKVSGLAPDAIAALKSTVLSLFEDGGNGYQGDSPQDPIPDAPSGDEPLQPTEKLKTIPGSVRHEPSFPRTELACALEDAPQSVLVGQCFELTCPLEDKPQQFAKLIKVNETVAYQRLHDGEVLAVYVGFSNKTRARQWGDWLTRTHSITHGYQLREAERLNTKWEIKLTPMTPAQIEKLALCDFSKEPRFECFSIPKRQPERVPSHARLANIGVGDTVRSRTVRHWEFRVIANVGEEFVTCERLGANPPIRQTLHFSSIELVRKADPVDVAAPDLAQQATSALDSIQPPMTQQFSFSLLESSNLDQKWAVSRPAPDGTPQFLGSVSCGTNTQRWSHSRQPRHGRNIPCFASKEAAAADLAKVYEQSHPPRELAPVDVALEAVGF